MNAGTSGGATPTRMPAHSTARTDRNARSNARAYFVVDRRVLSPGRWSRIRAPAREPRLRPRPEARRGVRRALVAAHKFRREPLNLSRFLGVACSAATLRLRSERLPRGRLVREIF